jgi:hypothetical protein
MKIQDLVQNEIEMQAREKSEVLAAARMRADKLMAAMAAMHIEFDDLYISPEDQSLHFSVEWDGERRVVVVDTWEQSGDKYQIQYSCDLCHWHGDWMKLTPENLAKVVFRKVTHRCPPSEPPLTAEIEDQIGLIEDHYPNERTALAVLVGMRAVVKALERLE